MISRMIKVGKRIAELFLALFQRICAIVFVDDHELMQGIGKPKELDIGARYFGDIVPGFGIGFNFFI